MTVKIAPGKSFEVVDDVRCLRMERVPGGSLLVTVSADGQTAEVAIEPRELRQMATFLADGG
jgi:hypothetical protein